MAVGAFFASMALTAPAAAHHGVPEEDGVAPGAERPGDRTFGKGQNKIHTIPIRRGGLLDYGRLPDGTPLLSHGPDHESGGSLEDPQPDSHQPNVPNTGNSLVDGTVDTVLNEAFGPEPGLPPPAPGAPIDCVAQGTANSYEVIYYIPLGGADDYDEFLEQLRNEVRNAMRRMVDEAVLEGDFYRTVKVETEVVAGACVPRIQMIDGTQPNTDFGSVAGDLSANFDRNQPNRKYLVYVEGAPGCGQGTIYRDESKSPANQHNTSTGYAQIRPSCWGNFGATTLHEIGHNLSAVQACVTWQGNFLTTGAPHNNTVGCVVAGGAERFHCWDEADRMCQADGGGDPSQNICPAHDWQREWPVGDWFDCNHDDYFNPDPAAGNWLATHFNIANDSLLVEQADLTDPVVGAGTDVADSSPVTANEQLYATTGDDRFAHKVNLKASAADNWGVVRFVVARSGRMPFGLDGACPPGPYPTGATFTFENPEQERTAESISVRERFGITRAGCYRFEISSVDRAGRSGQYAEILKVSTPVDDAVEPVKDLLDSL